MASSGKLGHHENHRIARLQFAHPMTNMIAKTDNPSNSHETGPSELLPPPDGGGAGRYALFLDIDGTLLDFANTPDSVVVAATLADLLAQLQRSLNGALALISGRSLSTIDMFFTPHIFAAAGLHGLELRDAHGHAVRFDADIHAMTALRTGMQAIGNRYPDLVVEDKGSSLALHYRHTPLMASIAVDEASRLAGLMGPGFVLQPGDHVVEIRPSGPNKGHALTSLMTSAPFAGRVPIAVGDDHTDEHAFEAVEAFCGHAVIVGARRPTRARHALTGPRAVRTWLSQFLTRIEREGSA
jgi:trehalose 6-phosphate phosphatase